MSATTLQKRHEKAVGMLSQLVDVCDPAGVVESLSVGLNLLRDLFLTRMHDDVESYFGIDSMLAPMSASAERKELQQAKLEIEVYNIAVAAHELRDRSIVTQSLGEASQWLVQLRLGDEIPAPLRHRLDGYLKRTAAERRLMFAAIVEHALPEATKAPLIVYRLYPRAVRVAVAMAFGEPLRAAEQRNEQLALLPSIGDCDACHGRPLSNGEICSKCGNPFWNLSWLNAAD